MALPDWFSPDGLVHKRDPFLADRVISDYEFRGHRVKDLHWGGDEWMMRRLLTRGRLFQQMEKRRRG